MVHIICDFIILNSYNMHGTFNITTLESRNRKTCGKGTTWRYVHRCVNERPNIQMNGSDGVKWIQLAKWWCPLTWL